ncbi:MAG TPA: hypothetical protein VMJ10_14315 [Kofleriaceae bacterium]|nr:hypothetical protein [Kofleriaceae bacterium]
MAELRLAALALTSCANAGAGPTTVAGPPGWSAIETLARAAGDAAKADGVAVDATGAWGDPARGCYALAIELRGGGDAQKLVDGIASAGIATRDVVYEGTAVTLGVARAPYDGRVRAEIASDGRVAARACFWNEREPAGCAAACGGWMR